MTQGNYVSDDTDNLIRRAQQTMDSVPVLDLRNWQEPRYMSGDAQIRSLSPACHRIVVKNTITVTDATIVTCATTTPGDCTEPTGCPTTVDPATTGYYNLVATVDASAGQAGVVIEFCYLKNDQPVTFPIADYQKAVTLVPGPQTVYLFAVNQPLVADDTLTLYGARIVSQ